MTHWALDRSPLPAFILSYKTNTLSKRRIIYHRGFPRICSILLPMEMKANKFGHLSFSERMTSSKRAHQMSMTSVQSYVSVKLHISDIGVTLCVSEPSSLYQWHWCNLTCKWNFDIGAIIRVSEPSRLFPWCCDNLTCQRTPSLLRLHWNSLTCQWSRPKYVLMCYM